jgi:hypothetical protein
MRSCFATRFGPEPFAAMLAELHYLDHAHRELLYLSALISSPTPHPSSSPESFSTFSDSQRYAGAIPSTQFCKGIFVDWMRAYRPFFDRVMSSLPGKVLRGDHSFPLTKLLAGVGGVQTHTACYSVVNEYEECRAQALTLTKSLSYVADCYKGIATSLQHYGHEATKLMYTDNAQAE